MIAARPSARPQVRKCRSGLIEGRAHIGVGVEIGPGRSKRGPGLKPSKAPLRHVVDQRVVLAFRHLRVAGQVPLGIEEAAFQDQDGGFVHGRSFLRRGDGGGGRSGAATTAVLAWLGLRQGGGSAVTRARRAALGLAVAQIVRQRVEAGLAHLAIDLEIARRVERGAGIAPFAAAVADEMGAAGPACRPRRRGSVSGTKARRTACWRRPAPCLPCAAARRRDRSSAGSGASACGPGGRRPPSAAGASCPGSSGWLPRAGRERLPVPRARRSNAPCSSVRSRSSAPLTSWTSLVARSSFRRTTASWSPCFWLRSPTRVSSS